ncbi:MAG TPA: hypothetical protein GX742_01325 [Acholeplasmataceae bacterium]|nr:hypothetical protein [Acholeplasmataceae bacterium]
MLYEKLRYQPNKKSQLLIIGGMAFMVYALFKVINVYRYTNQSTAGIIAPTLSLGIEILIAIFVMLLSFLLSEKFKSYDAKWNKVGFILAIYSFVKIFIFPIIVYNKFNELIDEGQTIKYNPKSWLIIVIVCLVISSILFLVGTIINVIKSKQLKKYFEELDSSNAK